MTDTLHQFVANKLWLLIAIVTFALVILFDAAGIELLEDATMIVGWFLLTPIFLFFGDEIAGVALDRADDSGGRVGDGSADRDPAELLKERYAAGEITDAEFERKLERLMALDEVDAPAAAFETLLDDRGDDPDGPEVSDAVGESARDGEADRDRNGTGRTRARDR